MLYKELVEVYKKLESTTSKLEKTEILAKFFSQVPSEDLEIAVNLASGFIFPPYSELELGVATQLMIRALAKTCGFSPKEIERKFAETGDLGIVAEELVKRKKQRPIFARELTLDYIYNTFEKIAKASGKGAQEKKLDLIVSLLHFASPEEAKYLTRTILGELRIGVAEGIVRDAIASAFLLKPGSSKEEKERAIEAVDYAYNILCDFGEVAKIAKQKGIKGLREVKIVVGRPVKVMLAEKAKNIEEAMRALGGEVAIEFKYDGMRAQIHKKGDKIWVYTRRLENVTKQFPDLVELARRNLKCDECVVEGEVWAISKETGMPFPFQAVSYTHLTLPTTERV